MDNVLALVYLNVNATEHVVSYSAGSEIYFRPSRAGGAPARVHAVLTSHRASRRAPIFAADARACMASVRL
jgi:hypothetical protein